MVCTMSAPRQQAPRRASGRVAEPVSPPSKFGGRERDIPALRSELGPLHRLPGLRAVRQEISLRAHASTNSKGSPLFYTVNGSANASVTMKSVILASLALLAACPAVHAQETPAPTPATDASATATNAAKPDQLEAIVVNGIRKGDLIMPTTVTSTSAYGLDLGVLDTPRNNTVLSSAQLDALNIQNPQGFSFLTSSSYSDASFGVPNVPRIRGQYADVYFNGMRDSFTSNGYGAPISFNSVDQMDIVKGPASVQAGPGAGVGGAIDITTKLPNPSKLTGSAFLQLDTLQKRRLNLDIGGPASENLSYRLSYTGDLSGSYYNGMYFHQESLYGVVVANITPKYTVQFNSEYVDARYRENDGINRVNQQLIDNGSYLTGAPPASAILSYLTPVTLGNPVQLSREVIIDQAPGTSARAARYNAQLIQTYEVADNLTLVNNTFYNFINRYNVIPDYYADTAQASFTIENKTDLKFKFATPMLGLLMNQSMDGGVSLRYAHVDTIQNFAAETVSVFDLTGSPSSWNVTDLQAGAGAFPYTAAFGSQQYGVPARGAFGLYLNSTINSNLYDAAAFVEHRIELTPTASIMYGLRADAVHLIESDPLGGSAPISVPINGVNVNLPSAESTPWYALGNGNISPVYHPAPWMSTYLTYNFAQYVLPTGNDGGVGTFGVSPTSVLRQNTHLVEAGSKFDLLDKSLFISAAVYEQTRSVNTGPGTDSSTAHIKGLELEANYQPGPRVFATASYSFLRTVLDTPASFYDFPAQPGLNYDGGGTVAAFAPGQTFNDPGIPRHLFNFLINYKDPSGFGAQANLQVIGKIETTQSGQLDLKQTLANLETDSAFFGALTSLNGVVPQSVLNNGGYYQSPVIPWQYTINTSAFYKYKNYEFKVSIYNLTDRRNLTNDIPFYGNDFITVNPPRSYAISIKAKFG
jgi:outer membrane receptor for monomeric catechols